MIDIDQLKDNTEITLTYDEWGDLVRLKADSYRIPSVNSGVVYTGKTEKISIEVEDIDPINQTCRAFVRRTTWKDMEATISEFLNRKFNR